MAIEVEMDGIICGETADTVTYQPNGGDAVEVSAVQADSSGAADNTSNGDFENMESTWLFSAEDIPAPSTADTVLVNGISWYVDGWSKAGNNGYAVDLVRRVSV